MRHRAALLLLCFAIWTDAARADVIRVATFNTEASRKGPGLLLRDLRKGQDPQLAAIIATIVAGNADILAVQSLDWDRELSALGALRDQLSDAGLTYPYGFALRPNAGVPSGLDLDGDGRLGEPEDAWGWGRFTGQAGIALLSKYPIHQERALDLTNLRWKDIPDHRMPLTDDGSPFPSADVATELRLSSTNHWAVPVALPDSPPLWVLSFHAAPPVFDGPEDRNGRRNADEIQLWLHLLDGSLDGSLGVGPASTIAAPFVILGDANNDPDRGEGHKDALHSLLSDPRLQDPIAADAEGPHTVVWERTGPMRVDYVLPSAGLDIVASGILRSKGSRHGLVWVDFRQ
ncbi:endonuclease/exonuclease/phosphatase family protein [Phaeobacter sp. B1627]|uniref:endonuclease/exonuclease/phosphatase family protein n=1 Tax=Phaeobacter sp. B1627 TaxID=2583809 RepID=UPI00111B0B24|nr:endonuclease/exonuclease/phosphatase family protein [Phaeobacter sp. B1627]TNJ47498.1 endonuclease/exonuclease/phosphatase family protein [Phaeobacter sp. B1627]